MSTHCHTTNRNLVQDQIFAWASGLGAHNNNVVTRNLCGTCHELREFDRSTQTNAVPYVLDKAGQGTIPCYGCGKRCKKMHPVYVFSCMTCGKIFQRNRHLQRDLTGRFALVVGARTKLGHQVVVKLLAAGATVVGTTRKPDEALRIFCAYPEWHDRGWKDRLFFFPEPLDLDVPDISRRASVLLSFLTSFEHPVRAPCLDVVVFCAAQTIRVREKEMKDTRTHYSNAPLDKETETNRYGDAKHVPVDMPSENAQEQERRVQTKTINSWCMRLEDMDQREMEEVYRINAVAPTLMVQALMPLLMECRDQGPYIINVHAREGLFDVHKNDLHLHTNMAKAALGMLTKCLASTALKTRTGHRFRVHGCDPGWISVDEYYEAKKPWIVPPLDEIDGAARILYPVMRGLSTSSKKTRRHFEHLTY